VQLAYAVHAGAETLGGAVKQVRLYAAARTSTTADAGIAAAADAAVERAGDAVAEQIEVVDRVIEQLGGDFVLHRAAPQATSSASIRRATSRRTGRPAAAGSG